MGEALCQPHRDAAQLCNDPEECRESRYSLHTNICGGTQHGRASINLYVPDFPMAQMLPT